MNLFQFYKRALSHHLCKVALIMIGDGFQAAFALMIPFALKNIIDNLEEIDSKATANAWETMTYPFLFFVFLIVAQELASRLSGMTMAFYAGQVRLKPRLNLVTYLQSHSMNFFQNMHAGGLGSRINEACTGLGFSLWTIFFDLWPMIIKVATGIILLFIFMPTLGFFTLVWYLIYFAISIIFGYKQFIWSERLSRARSNITGKVVDMATNIYVVKSYANEAHEKDIINEANNNERRVINNFQVFREGGAIVNSILLMVLMIYLGYFCIDGYINNTLSLGDVSLAISMLLLLTSNMRQLVWAVTNLLEYVGQTREGVNTIYRAHTVTDKKDAGTLTVKKASIELDKACFAYPEKKDVLIFDQLDLKIPAGQKIGLVGQSGAGKSTLLNLILRFFDLTGGQIRIDGQNIADLTQQSLRKQIAVIPQDTSLFHRTLMDNIRYGSLDATDEEVIEAAKKAYAHDFIKTLPQGYDTMVGERGVKLSGGQRQRISIACAILKDAPILILDEATSALDSESEKAIQDSLKDLMRGKTVIAIAHRLSTIAHMDRIIVMEDGKIVEDGTHAELLKLDRHYAMLWSMQSGGFLTSS